MEAEWLSLINLMQNTSLSRQGGRFLEELKVNGALRNDFLLITNLNNSLLA